MENWILIVNLIAVVLVASFYMVYQHRRWKKAFGMLEQQKLNHEISILKNQMSPHFILNTINNISVLIEVDPIRSQDLLIKFGELLRYSTYDVGHSKVELKKSLSYLEKYMELQKIRYPQDNAIECTIKGYSEDKYLAPMIILPFIENAFKYAHFKDTSNPGISIFGEIYEDSLYFKIVNQYRKQPGSFKKSTGIGIRNTKKRLNLIYPDQHKLKISRQKGYFNVELTINNLRRDEKTKLYSH